MAVLQSPAWASRPIRGRRRPCTACPGTASQLYFLRQDVHRREQLWSSPHTRQTCRPPTEQNIAWGATFDEGLVAEIGAAIAVEARAKWLEGLAPDGSSAEFAGLSFM